MLSESDKDQFGWAVSQERAIVTFNFSDFMVIHEEYLASGGNISA